MISIQNLSFRYSSRRPPVISGMTAELEPGKIYGLLGPNGAGKSTLLYLIAGALIPGQGRVLINDTDSRLRLPSTLASFFIVPEEMDLPKISLKKYIAVNAPFYPKFDNGVMNRCLETFGFDIERTRNLKSLSMGQRKKIIISFAFACQTEILLLDEPTNGLDIPGKMAFRQLCASLMTDDRMMIISTHQVRDLDQILDHVMVMNLQSLIFSRSTAEIQSKLAFLNNINRTEADGALASIPSPGGFDIMIPNESGSETEINLELLFGYALQNPHKLNEILDNDGQ